MNYMECCNSAFCKGRVVCASFSAALIILWVKLKSREECGHNLCALCNECESNSRYMKKGKGEEKRKLFIYKYWKVFHAEILEQYIISRVLSSIYKFMELVFICKNSLGNISTCWKCFFFFFFDHLENTFRHYW